MSINNLSRMPKLSVFIVFVVSALLFFCSCSKENENGFVVLYSSVDQTYTSEVIEAFTEKTGIEVKLVSDTEAAKSTGLMNRLIAEKSRPVADVFWSGDPIRAARLEDLEVGSVIDEKGSAWRFRCVIVHEERSEGLSELKSIFDMAKPEFAPLSCIANPQFGTTTMHFAVLYEVYGEEKVNQFLGDFKANGGKLVASNGEVKRRVGNGEFAFGLTDSDDVNVALVDGKPVKFIIPDAQEQGVVAIPTVPVKITNAPHSELADKLIDFLLSAETEKIMALSDAAHIPLNDEVLAPEQFGDVVKSQKWMDYDIKKVSERIAKMRPSLDEWVASMMR